MDKARKISLNIAVLFAYCRESIYNEDISVNIQADFS